MTHSASPWQANGHDSIIVNARGERRAVAPDTGALALALTVNQLSVKIARMELARRMGQTHAGKRDTWPIFGYPDDIQLDDYFAWYRRDGMARRIVELPVQDTWKDGFVLVDGSEKSSDDQSKSAFLLRWKELEKRLKIGYYFRKVDRLARTGHYAVLLIGVADNSALSEPVVGQVSDIAYLRCYREKLAEIQKGDIIQEQGNPRRGLPEYYWIDTGVKNASGSTREKVHYTRLIHVQEDSDDDELNGAPALEAPYNRLIDKEKVVGGGAEAYWLLVHRGLAIIAEEGFTDDSAELAAFQEQVDAWKHNLDRVMRLSGKTKLQELGGETPDPAAAYDVILSELSAATGIPKRKLIGSEEARLAGEQDERAWGDQMQARRVDHAESVIIDPFVDWCLRHGVLPPPASGDYEVEWPSPYQLTETEEAETAERWSNAIARYAGPFLDPTMVMPLDVFQERVLRIAPTASEGALLDEEDGELGDVEE